MKRTIGLFMSSVGGLMIGMWSFFLLAGLVPELKAVPFMTATHVAAEFSTGVLLLIGGIFLIKKKPGGESVAFIALGMFFYAVIQAPGYYWQQGVFGYAAMFAVFLILGLAAVSILLRTSGISGPSTIMKPVDLTDRFKDALLRATDLHSDQRRKGSGVPYVAHLLGVASLVLEYGGTEDEAIAALLHDAVEDQGGKQTRRMIAEIYGETVAQIVDGCTDADTFPKPPWKERKEAYIAHVASASPSVLLVSACDKLYNARTILEDYRRVGDAIWDRFKGGKKDGTLWYYQSLVQEYKKAGSHPVYDELERTVKELLEMVNVS